MAVAPVDLLDVLKTAGVADQVRDLACREKRAQSQNASTWAASRDAGMKAHLSNMMWRQDIHYSRSMQCSGHVFKVLASAQELKFMTVPSEACAPVKLELSTSNSWRWWKAQNSRTGSVPSRCRPLSNQFKKSRLKI